MEKAVTFEKPVQGLFITAHLFSQKVHGTDLSDGTIDVSLTLYELEEVAREFEKTTKMKRKTGAQKQCPKIFCLSIFKK